MTTNGSSFWTSGAVPLIEPEFLGSIIGAASDIALVVSAEGMVLSVVLNSSEASFGDLSHWEGRSVLDFLTEESITKFRAAHTSYLAGDVPQKSLELNHIDAGAWQYPVRYTFHRFGQENAALLLGRDLRPIAETQQQLVQAQIALEQGYEARREFDARYRVVMGQTSDAIVFVAAQSGRIEDANAGAAALFGVKLDALVGSGLSSLVTEPSAGATLEALMTATLGDDQSDVVVPSKRAQSQLRLRPTIFRSGGQRMLMCQVSDVDAAAPTPNTAALQAAALFRKSTDAIVFTDAKGVIASVNEGFLDLIGAAHLADVVGKSMADFFARGQIDLGVLKDASERASPMRMYATKLRNELGGTTPVEISATRLEDEDVVGFGMILRDATRADTVRGGAGTGVGAADRNVVDLVGSASLKDIVAETTDVVEKMCIEAAVALTKNNRVAAAEMLGLSRQSLYVKLRKYDLLSKD
ncbi:transcriptional regulator PpsR [Ascidiaceihabitans sp.]|uniref:transcriptional regulator PpsR n=1 Tax=Ascidiaceihabitans sp. TaxID=1872644 RepID=UPI003297FAB6